MTEGVLTAERYTRMLYDLARNLPGLGGPSALESLTLEEAEGLLGHLNHELAALAKAARGG